MEREGKSLHEQVSSPGESDRQNSSMVQSFESISSKNLNDPKEVKITLRLGKEDQEVIEKKMKIIMSEDLSSGNDKKERFIKTISKIWQQVDQFSRNPDQQNFQWKYLCENVKEIRQNSAVMILETQKNRFIAFQEETQKNGYDFPQNSIIKITSSESAIWKGVCSIQDEMMLGMCEPGLQGIVKPQFEKSKNKLRDFSSYLSSSNKQENRENLLLEKINSEYYYLVILKTFKYGLVESPIEWMNYFKDKEFEEGHQRILKKPFQTEEEWIRFISKRRNKNRKGARHLLHTACQACLSPHSEGVNPIIICPQCHNRNHYCCLDLTNVERCGRCIYSRLSQYIRVNTPQCFLCPKNSLTPMRVSPNTFAHCFCLIANNLWACENGKVVMKHNPQIDRKSIQACAICGMRNKFCIKCNSCPRYYHPICAYFNGYRLEMNEDNNVEIDCHRPSHSQQQELSEQREYILNYDKIVFKKMKNLEKSVAAKKRKNGKLQ